MGNENHGFKGSAAVFFFTIGGLVGAAMGALFAPLEGRQTRTKVRELAEEVKDLTHRLSSGLKEKTSSLTTKAEAHKEERPTGAEIAPGTEEFDMRTTQPG